MSDLIDRQQAIDAMFNLCDRLSEPCYRCENPHIDVIVDELEQLPSAQPEIVRCKDCKWWHTDRLPVAGKHGCDKFCDFVKPDFYCGLAEKREATI